MFMGYINRFLEVHLESIKIILAEFNDYKLVRVPLSSGTKVV